MEIEDFKPGEKLPLSQLIARHFSLIAESHSYQTAIYNMLKRQLSDSEQKRVEEGRLQVYLRTLLDFAEDGVLSLDEEALEIIEAQLASIEKKSSNQD